MYSRFTEYFRKPTPSTNFLPRAPPSNTNADESDDHVVPDGSKDLQYITHRRFITMFMSGKLVLPPDYSQEVSFGAEDLEDLGQIGHGRFGIVCKMLHKPSNILLAVKKVRLISTQYDESEDEKQMRQLKTEVMMIQEASSFAEVVKFYGVTFHEGDCYICMELMDMSLEKLYQTVHNVDKSSFKEEVLIAIGGVVVKTLNCLKKLMHIMHRDIKPSNILLNLQGKIKLCDFGIAGYLEDSMAHTKDIGCRPYMAPERLTSSVELYDIRSDVWSLGITLIEVARGEFPYPNFGEQSFFAQIYQVVHGDPLCMKSTENYSSSTVHFINICLTKEYKDRPTFDDLMKSEFFGQYTAMKNREEVVSKYVQQMLELRQNAQ